MAEVWNRAFYEEMYAGGSWPYGVRHGPNGTRAPTFHYHWTIQRRRLERLVARYMALPGFASLSDVAIVGGGFGWTAELLAPHGINAISVETGPYIIDNENVSEEAELRELIIAQGLDPDNLPNLVDPNDPNGLLTTAQVWPHWLHASGGRTSIPVEQEDLQNTGSRRNVRQRLGNNLDAILSESVLDSMSTDAEALAVAESCQQLRPNPACTVIHLVSEGVTGGDPRLPLMAKTLEDWQALLTANGFTDHRVLNTRGRLL